MVGPVHATLLMVMWQTGVYVWTTQPVRGRIMRRIVALLAFALVAACTTKTISGSAERTLDGTWSGTYSGTTFILNVTSGGDGLLMGSGSVRASAETRPVAVMGTFVDPRVSFNMSTPGLDSLTFDGTRNGDALVGTLNGSGYSGESLTLSLHR